MSSRQVAIVSLGLGVSGSTLQSRSAMAFIRGPGLHPCGLFAWKRGNRTDGNTGARMKQEEPIRSAAQSPSYTSRGHE